jgi:hypothetical protein
MLYAIRHALKERFRHELDGSVGLYRYNPSGQYFARVRFGGKLYRRKLEAGDLEVAKRKLREFKMIWSAPMPTKATPASEKSSRIMRHPTFR